MTLTLIRSNDKFQFLTRGLTTFEGQLARDRAERAADRSESARDLALPAQDQAQKAAAASRDALSDIVSEKEVPIFSSRETVIATGIPSGLTAFRTNGFERAGDGSAPLYTVQDTQPSEKGAFFIPAISKWAKLCEDGVRPQFFGVVAGYNLNGAEPVPDSNNSGLAEWLAYLQSSTQPGSVTHLTAKEGYVPAGGYLYDESLYFTRPVGIRGEGGRRSMFWYAGAAQAVFGEFSGTDAQDMFGLSWKGIGFHPRAYGGGTTAILLNVHYSLSMMVFDDVVVDDFGGKALVMTNASGIFTGGGHEILLDSCQLRNGIAFNNIGDSIKIRNGFIQSARLDAQGRGFIGIEGSQIIEHGAAQFQIESTVVTCRGGAARLVNCTQPHIRQLWAEHPSWAGSWAGDPNQGGLVTLFNCPGATVTQSTLQPLQGIDGPDGPIVGAPYALTLGGNCENAHVADNLVQRGASGFVQLNEVPNIRIGKNWTLGEALSYEGVHRSTVIEGSPLAVRADRNGANLEVDAGADVRLTFTNVSANRLTFSESRWTPPRATVRIAAAFRVVGGDVDGDFAEIAIFKNGVEFRRSAPFARAGAGALGASIEITDEAKGTDVYSVYLFAGGGGSGSRTVSGLTKHTYFSGLVVD